jgi:preprotein translocase subunit SecD
LKTRLQAMEDSVSTELRRDQAIDVGDISTAGGRLSFMVRDPTKVDAAVERMRTLTKPVQLTGNRDWDVQVVDSTRVVLTPTQSGTAQALKDAMSVARDVVRRRIDPSGTKEITVITEGGNRVLVEVPGVEDPEGLKRLIGQTARLEFKLVDMSANQQDVQQGRAPPGSQVLPMADGTGFIAVKRRVMVSGEQVIKANQGYDQDGRPDIELGFNTAGARRFARATQENVGKPFAIILDDKVLSAPNINEPILGGSAQITGNFTVQSAHDLAVSLASGKLPVKLNVIEERTVSAELGADSIHKGMIASVVSVLAVIVFMLVTYGRFGVYANIALVVNAFLILGIMAMFNATLTLPGIAGFILTIGAAVDANVLINERIREEIRRGRRLIDAVETGYHEAFRAIFDANVTHVISAGIMAYFGSGPVRGFAVVLLIGVVTSVFTAVYFTRMLVALWIRRTRPRELHI